MHIEFQWTCFLSYGTLMKRISVHLYFRISKLFKCWLRILLSFLSSEGFQRSWRWFFVRWQWNLHLIMYFYFRNSWCLQIPAFHFLTMKYVAILGFLYFIVSVCGLFLSQTHIGFMILRRSLLKNQQWESILIQMINVDWFWKLMTSKLIWFFHYLRQ